MGGCTSKPKTLEYDVAFKPVEEKKNSFSDVHLASNPDSRRSPSLRSLFDAQEGEGAGTDWTSSTSVTVPAQERHSLVARTDLSLQDSRENEALPVRKQSFLSVLSREIKGLVVMPEQTKGGNQASTSENGRAGPSKTNNDGKCDDDLHVHGESAQYGFNSKGGNGPSTTENCSIEPVKATTNDGKDDSLCVRRASFEAACLQSGSESNISSKAMDSVKQEKEGAVQSGLIELDMAKEQKPVNNGGSECDTHQNEMGKQDSIKEIGMHEAERLKKDNLDDSCKAQVVNERIEMPKGSATEEGLSINCAMDLENTNRADLKELNDLKCALNMGEGEKAEKGMMKHEKGNEEHLLCREPVSCAIDLENTSMADQKGVCRDNRNVNDPKCTLNMVEGEKVEKGTMKHEKGNEEHLSCREPVCCAIDLENTSMADQKGVCRDNVNVNDPKCTLNMEGEKVEKGTLKREKGNEEHLLYKEPVSFAIDLENTSRADRKDVCRDNGNVNGLKNTLNIGEGETVEKGTMKHEKGNEEHLLYKEPVSFAIDLENTSRTDRKDVCRDNGNVNGPKNTLNIGAGETVEKGTMKHEKGNEEHLLNVSEIKEQELQTTEKVIDEGRFKSVELGQGDNSFAGKTELDLGLQNSKQGETLAAKEIEHNVTLNVNLTSDSDELPRNIPEQKQVERTIIMPAIDMNEFPAKIVEEKDRSGNVRPALDSNECSTKILEEKKDETGNIVPSFDSNESHAKIKEERDMTEMDVLDSNECSAKILEEKDEKEDFRAGRDSEVGFSNISEEEQKRSLKLASVLEQNSHPVLNSGKSREEERSKSKDPRDEGKQTDPKEKLEEESMRGDIEFCDGDLMTADEEHNKERKEKSDLVSDELRSGMENVSNDLNDNGNIGGVDLKGLTEKDNIFIQSSAEKVKEAEEAIAADEKLKEEGMGCGIEFCDEKGTVKPFLDIDVTKKVNRKNEEEQNEERIVKSDYEREDIRGVDSKGITEKEEKGVEANIPVQRSSDKVKEEEETIAADIKYDKGYKKHTLDSDDSIDTCKLAKLNNEEVGSKGLSDKCLFEAESGLDLSSVANVDIPIERLEGSEFQDQDKASTAGTLEVAYTHNRCLSPDLKVHNICRAGTEDISSFTESSVQKATEPADSSMPSNEIVHETLPCVVNLSDGNVTEIQQEKMDEHSNNAVVGKPVELATGAVGKAE